MESAGKAPPAPEGPPQAFGCYLVKPSSAEETGAGFSLVPNFRAGSTTAAPSFRAGSSTNAAPSFQAKSSTNAAPSFQAGSSTNAAPSFQAGASTTAAPCFQAGASTAFSSKSLYALGRARMGAPRQEVWRWIQRLVGLQCRVCRRIRELLVEDQ